MNARFVVGVGAQKTATTSIADFLAAHGVAIHPKKELHAFDRPQVELSREQYLSKFPTLPSEGWFGEFTPNYCGQPAALLNLSRMFPDAKVVFGYRDPIRRLQSAYRHAVAERHMPRTIDINQAIELGFRGNNNFWVDNLLRFGQYDVMLRMLERTFQPENLYVLRYEDLGTEHEATALAGLLGLLGLERDASIALDHLNTGDYQQWAGKFQADVTISEANLYRLKEYFASVERFMRERGYRTEWF